MQISPTPLHWNQLADFPDSEGFAGSYAGVSQGALIVTGGANFPEKAMWEGGSKRWASRVFFMSPDRSGWSEAAPLPMPLGYGASVNLPEGMLIIGGSNISGAKADCLLLRYENGTVVCESYPSLPRPLTGHAAVMMQGKVYVTGGSVAVGEQDAESRMLIFDPASKCWSEGPELPARGRFLHQMASQGHSLYVLGGIALKDGDNGKMARDMTTEAWSFSDASGWRRLSNLPHLCAAAPTPAPIFEGQIFLLGGDDATVTGYSAQEHPGFHSQSLSYSIAQDRWSDAGEIPAPRAVLPCTTWQGMAIIVNGELRPGKRSNQVWAINLK